MKNNILFFLALISVAVIGCEDEYKARNGSDVMENLFLSNSDSIILTNKSFFFGHQSVGYNVLDGVEGLKVDHPEVTLQIHEGHTGNEVKAGTLLHSKIGRNNDPASKISAFVKLMDDGLGGSVDVAFFKFCYIDFNEKTNFKAVFNEYKNTMDGLQARYPKTLFVHVTVPLMSVQRGPKAWIKKLIGRALDGVNDNIVRNRYNELLRKEYTDSIIFDIARAESTKANGSRQTFVKNRKTYYSLMPGYTNDRGHLNEKGKIRIAETFLKALAEAGKVNDADEK